MTENAKALRKAAVLISILDRETADAMLDQAGPEAAQRIRHTVISLGKVPLSEQEEVLEEFLQQQNSTAAAPESEDEGVELEISAAGNAGADAMPAAQPHSNANTQEQRPPFRFLHEATGEMIAPHLINEHPQTIAIVLSHLPPNQAADVLVRLPGDLQVEAIQRVVHLDETDAEIIATVERELESTLSEQIQAKQKRKAGMAAVSAIIEAAGAEEGNSLLTILALRDQQLAGHLRNPVKNTEPRSRPGTHTSKRSLSAKYPRKTSAVKGPNGPSRPRVFNPEKQLKTSTQKNGVHQEPLPEGAFPFAELGNLQDAELKTVLCAVDPEIAILALTGADEQLVDRILARFSPQQAQSFRQHMEQQGPIRLRDIEQAQTEMVRIATQLCEEGKIHVGASRKRFAAAA